MLAGGTGRRMGRPKQFIELLGMPALHYTLRAFEESPEIARVLGYGSAGQLEEMFIKPRGYRQLERVPRLPRRVAESLIREFGSLEELLEATEEELDEVEGVGQARARTIQRGLERQRGQETMGEVS